MKSLTHTQFTNVIVDLASRQFTQGQIAKRNHCSVSAVSRIAKKHNLGVGQGIRNFWEFSKMTPPLAYLIGLFLTDGTLTANCRQLSYTSTKYEIINEASKSLSNLGFKPSSGFTAVPKGKKGNKPQYHVRIYCSMFTKWLKIACESKMQIPTVVMTAQTECQLAFLAGVIDGDGAVGKDGSIKIRGVGGWLSQLPDLLAQMDIKTTGYQLERMLPSGKNYCRVTINRADFVKLGGYCYHPTKLDRIINAKETRYKVCKCGRKIMNRSAAQCRICYQESRNEPKRDRKVPCPYCDGIKSRYSKMCYKCRAKLQKHG